MSVDPSTLPPEEHAQSVTNLVGTKLISSARAYRIASTSVVEITFSDSTVNYIKVGAGNSLEIGGTNQMGTGTQVTW